MYREGSKDRIMNKQIQKALGIVTDGFFGPKTTAAVIRFQMSYGLVADGIVGRKTLEEMGILDTDLKGNNLYKTRNGLSITRHLLPKGEFIQNEAPILNDYLFFHHTSGWHNPYKVIDHWGKDVRGRIATEFVIGGQNIKTGDDKYDGEVVQAFPDGCQGWHLGATGSRYMNRHSVGIELCAFGYLTENNKTYVGTKAHNDQIVMISEPFRGHVKWHRYSDDQLKSMRKLFIHVSERDDIDLHVGIYEWIHKSGPTKAFDFQPEAYNGDVKGLLTHTNVRKDKTDCFPQAELIDMILSL